MRLFEGSISLSDVMNAPYSLLYSIRKRYEEENRKEAEARMKEQGGGGYSPPAMEQRAIKQSSFNSR